MPRIFNFVARGVFYGVIRNARVVSSTPTPTPPPPPGDNWVLVNGVWTDSNEWDDSKTWQDEPQ